MPPDTILPTDTHPCVHTAVPVSEEICRRLTSQAAKNQGCYKAQCKSPWRMCKTCVTSLSNERSDGPVDPIGGLCEQHGGVIVPVEVASVQQIEFAEQVLTIPVDHVSPLPDQPRKHFDEVELEKLAANIKQRGQIHPGLVVATPNGPCPYELRDGERRWRSCKIAGVDFRATLQVSVEAGENEKLLTSAAANFHRADHTPFEEIEMVLRLLSPCPDTGLVFTQTQVAENLGQSHSVWVSERKVVGERLSPEAMNFIKKHVDVPFSVIKQIADHPHDEQLTVLSDYLAGKINSVTLRQNAGFHRRKAGLSRQRKPSDRWDQGSSLVDTIRDRADRVGGIFGPEDLEGSLRELVLARGGSIAETLDQTSALLSGVAERIRKVRQASTEQ